MDRKNDILTFYQILERIQEKFPARSLKDLDKSKLPQQGVYFFIDPREYRENKKSHKVVRVGTHAARANSKANLYERLSTHKGNIDLTGNHRFSVFRKLVGYSLIKFDSLDFQYWGDRKKMGYRDVIDTEKPLEQKVSAYLYSLTFTVIEVLGPSAKDNDRALIEQNSIALLSNYNKTKIDSCSKNWLGLLSMSRDDKVPKSELWNDRYVDKCYGNNYFKILEYHLSRMKTY